MVKKYYEFFEPNPSVAMGQKGKGDCTIRALCAATGKTWLEVFDELVKIARERFDEVNALTVVIEYAERLGFMPCKVTVKKGTKRPTMKTLIQKYPGKIIIGQCAGHMMCAVGGVVRDRWDSSEKPLYKYWVK